MKTFKAGQLAFFISRFPAPSDIPPTRAHKHIISAPTPIPRFILHSFPCIRNMTHSTGHNAALPLSTLRSPLSRPISTKHTYHILARRLFSPYPFSPNHLHNSTTVLVHIPRPRSTLPPYIPPARKHSPRTKYLTFHLFSSSTPGIPHTHSLAKFPPLSFLHLAETVSTDTLTTTHIFSTHDTPRSPLCPPPHLPRDIPSAHSLAKFPPPSFLHLAETVSTDTLTTTHIISHTIHPVLLFVLLPPPPPAFRIHTPSQNSSPLLPPPRRLYPLTR